MRTGTVKWFNARKGYGVIHPTDGGFNLYVDIAAVSRAGLAGLQVGQKIAFEAVTDKRTGEVFAENLRVPPTAPAATAPPPGPSPERKPRWFGGLSRAMRLASLSAPVEVAVTTTAGSRRDLRSAAVKLPKL